MTPGMMPFLVPKRTNEEPPEKVSTKTIVITIIAGLVLAAGLIIGLNIYGL